MKNTSQIYTNTAYDSKERFCSYWHQIDEVMALRPDRVLEIGVGNGFVNNYLRTKGINICTLDIFEALKPDIAGSLLNIPFKHESFDVVLCCQVLEHLPYKDFSSAFSEIFRVSKKHVIISLPDVTTVYRINLEIPRLNVPIKKLVPHPFPRFAQHEFDGEHFWEIGKRGYPLKKICNDMLINRFKIIKTYRVYEYYYHRFFILRKMVGSINNIIDYDK